MAVEMLISGGSSDVLSSYLSGSGRSPLCHHAGMIPTRNPVTRFAPSPTGLLHLGHAYSALLAHGAARAAGGRFLLRIEDIDTGRCRDEFVAATEADLAWLGQTGRASCRERGCQHR